MSRQFTSCGARQLTMPVRAQSFSNMNTPAEYAANYPQQLLPESD
ncbi:hypothetical protein [Microbulbifer sp. SH-1]|nr:hypothetical protein [Microbulbifer sp. SH-1]